MEFPFQSTLSVKIFGLAPEWQNRHRHESYNLAVNLIQKFRKYSFQLSKMILPSYFSLLCCGGSKECLWSTEVTSCRTRQL